MDPSLASPGQLIGGRYRLERQLIADGSPGAALTAQGCLWLARDQLASEAPCALRQLGPTADQERVRDVWARLQGVLHPQVPRLGPALQQDDQLWLVREWQAGRTYAQMLAARSERQLVFGAGEVLLLLRQLLPVLAALHSQELLHGDLSPDNLLRRDSDGLPVLLDFGLVRGTANEAGSAPLGATPGYAPPELGRGAPAEPWMDLHALGVVALVLLSGDPPANLLDPASLAWRWPVALEREPALQAQLQRLLEREPSRRFASAGQALVALQALEVPDSTGPVPRADRTVMLVPPANEGSAAQGPIERDSAAMLASDAGAVAAIDEDWPPAPAVQQGGGEDHQPAAAAGPRLTTVAPLTPAQLARQREDSAEGGLWPVLVALVLSAVVGTAIGWWWLGGGRLPGASGDLGAEQAVTLPPGEVDQRQQLLDRLRALQVDRDWFLKLVNASFLSQYPERRGRLPDDSLEDAPLRKVWNELAEEWLARVEQLPLPLRERLGSISEGDWQRRRDRLQSLGIADSVLRHLVSASARSLLPGRSGEGLPEEPFRQLWYAAAEQVLDNLRIDPIEVSSLAQTLAASVPADGARLFVVRLPAGQGLNLQVSGSPLLQMSIYAGDGTRIEANGPLRTLSLSAAQATPPLQLIVSNDGVASAPIALKLWAYAAPVSPVAPPDGAVPALPPTEGVSSSEEPPPAAGPSPSAPDPAAPSSPAPAAPSPP